MSDPAPSNNDATPNNDPELRAMLALIKYLTPLDRQAVERTLEWAKARFLPERFTDLKEMPFDAFEKFTKTVAGVARDIDGMSGHDILRAAAEVAAVRQTLGDEVIEQASRSEASSSS
jgi:hypothetical protein